MSMPNSAHVRAMPGNRFRTRSGVQMAQIQKHARLPRLLHLRDDRPAHDVARRQLGPLVVVGHEPPAGRVDQPRAFAAHRFGDQAAAAAGDVQHRRMKLHELHVAQLGAGAIRERLAVAGRHFGIRRLAINLPGAARAQNRLLGPDERAAVLGVPHERAAAAAFVREQIDRERVRPDLGVVLRSRTRSIIARITSWPVASPSACTMRRWLCPPSRPSISSPSSVSKFVPHSISWRMCSRRFADDHLDDFAIAQIGAGDERVVDMAVEVVLRIEHAGDAALGVRAVRLLHRVLGDHQQRQPRIDLHRRPQAGNAAADDQHIGKVMRNPLGMKRHQVSRNVAAWSMRRSSILRRPFYSPAAHARRPDCRPAAAPDIRAARARDSLRADRASCRP